MTGSDGIEDVRRKVIEFWDTHAEHFSRYTDVCLASNGWVSERLNDLLPGAKNLKVADIGTGAGFIAISLAEMGHRVVATDISEKMLGYAREKAVSRNLTIEFLNDDAENTSLETDSFDLIFLRDVLSNLSDPLKTLESIMGLLRPGGFLVISDGNYFLYKHDEAYRRRDEYFRLRDGEGEYCSMLDLPKEDYSVLADIAGDLESSRHRGPQWQTDFLLRKGMNNIRLRCDDPVEYHQNLDFGKEQVPFRYSIICQKPYLGPDKQPKGRFDKSHMFSDPLEPAEDIGRCFTALSDGSRIRLLEHLLEGPSSVSELAEISELSVNKASYHLNILKEIGLVRSEKDGRTVRYYLSDEGAVEYLLHTISGIIRHR